MYKKRKITIVLIIIACILSAIGILSYKYYQYIKLKTPFSMDKELNALILSYPEYDVLDSSNLFINGFSCQYGNDIKNPTFEGKISTHPMNVDDLLMEYAVFAEFPYTDNPNKVNYLVGFLKFYKPDVEYMDRLYDISLYQQHTIYCDSIYFNECTIIMPDGTIIVAPAESKEEAINILRRFNRYSN